MNDDPHFPEGSVRFHGFLSSPFSPECHSRYQSIMKLNADFTKRAVVHSADEPWVASPMPGVDRRMLDRIGDEVALREDRVNECKLRLSEVSGMVLPTAHLW